MNYTHDELLAIVKDSQSFAQVLQRLNMRKGSSTYGTLKKRIKEWNLDVSHLNSMHPHRTEAWALEEILIQNSQYSHVRSLKRRLIKTGLLSPQCYADNCTVQQQWLDKSLVLQLDHINGIRNDNRLQNLRLLCPNCHSQTPTFSGRNLPKAVKGKCKACNQSVSSRYSTFCLPCSRKQEHKIVWPDIDNLLNMLKESSYVSVGKSLGITDNAIRKHLKTNGINPKTLISE